VLDLLFPSVCLGCGCLVREEGDVTLCSRCRPEYQSLPPTPAHRDGALLAYDGPARRALHRLKYHRDIAWAGPLGAALARAAHLQPDAGFDLVVPVPLHRSRLWARGFNQSWLLLRAAGRVHGRRLLRHLDADVLDRHRRTATQTDLPASARWANVDGAFRLRASARARVYGRRILLVDDVATTGATLRAAAGPLRDAGATVVALALMQAQQ
jgi:ComF family protein